LLALVPQHRPFSLDILMRLHCSRSLRC
jgi:hypothetical protein